MNQKESLSNAKVAIVFQLTSQQIDELLNIISSNHCLVIGKEFNPEFLTYYDKLLLNEYGVKVDELYQPHNDTVYTSLHWGILSDSLEALRVAKKNTYEDLKEYIKGGRYIPLTKKEEAIINNIKTQDLSSLKTNGGKIFQDVKEILENNSLEGQQEFLKKEVVEGTLKKWTVSKIASEIAHKTGDWSRNFDHIVEYISQTAYEAGYNEKTNSLDIYDEKERPQLKKPREKIKAIINGVEVWI
jgi:hypothetical protein